MVKAVSMDFPKYVVFCSIFESDRGLHLEKIIE